MKRYEQMLSLVAEFAPSTVVEVGVHRAVRASMLCAEALVHAPSVSYVGYDVFETETQRFQDEALNGKGMATEGAARARLSLAQSKSEGRMSFRFVIGDTRRTLHGTKVEVDFAFIDGDHRADTIIEDYRALALSRCVVLDDFYLPDSQGKIVDTSRYGANRLVDLIHPDYASVEILPQGDQTRHGGLSHLVVIRRK